MMMTRANHALTEPTQVSTGAPHGATYEPPHPTLVQPQQSVVDLLVRGKLPGVLLQDLATIPTSIPWLRSQRYWAKAEAEVFISEDVPNVVTSNGEASFKAVEMYLASLRAAEQSGCREASSYVLELGTGMGLFAKLFLDQLRARSPRDYERTTYIVADYSKSLLEDTRKTGMFAAHEERVRRVHLPTRDWPGALAAALPEAVGAIRAIHVNYLLDSLPFTILSCFDGRLFELRIRTRLRQDLLKPGMTPPSTTDAAEVESWLADVLESAPQAAANTALEFEAEYVPVEVESLPLPGLIPDLTNVVVPDSTPGASVQFLHGYGAIEFLTEALDALRTDGYFVALDFEIECPRSGPLYFQMYGSSVAVGVNFGQLVAFAKVLPGCQVGVPPKESPELQARCFARDQVPSEIIRTFETLYSKETSDRLEAPMRVGAQRAADGHFDAARASFAEAYRLQPFNWLVLEKIAKFLASTVHDHEAGLDIARRALLINHWRPELWNLVGDCHFNLGDIAAAEQAYREAIRLNPNDPRSVANLAWVCLKRKEIAEALRLIGQALALDPHEQLKEELLQKQKEAMMARALAAQGDRSHSMRRLSGLFALPGSIPVGQSTNAASVGQSTNGVVRGST